MGNAGEHGEYPAVVTAFYYERDAQGLPQAWLASSQWVRMTHEIQDSLAHTPQHSRHKRNARQTHFPSPITRCLAQIALDADNTGMLGQEYGPGISPTPPWAACCRDGRD